MSSANLLQEDFQVHYTYTRSTGPVIGDFLTALRDRKQILGSKTSDGRVLVPPMEFDPATKAALTELVEVADEGTVSSFCWVKQPTPHHHIQQPFAFAMIRLDGADSDFIHMVDCGSEDKLQNGARVKAQWADDRQGAMTDIRCFKLVE